MSAYTGRTTLKRRWQIFKSDPDLSKKLATELNISEITAQILINREINNVKDGESFLKPKLNNLSNPFDIPNIRDATKRILKARERGEKVLVYGDYDVDGVAGTVIVLSTLRLLGINASYYIPHRYKEGYGLNIDAIKKFKEDGINLIVTVDCGIGNLIEIELANSLGIDVVITDHHSPPHALPKAIAIVNPKLINGDHPSLNLSGAGVAFKFAWALLKEFGASPEFLGDNLDLASLGTIADVVPLLSENRILATCGLSAISQRKRPGIAQLVDIARLPSKISTWHVNFVIAPRINAAGRIEHARVSVDLLMSQDLGEARKIAENLDRMNKERQSLGSLIQEEAFKFLDESVVDDSKLLFLEGDGWHPGVIGIVASQIVERFYRPTILVGINDGIGRGSARSIDGLNIFELLGSCRDLYLDFGGHSGAAGFEIQPENIPELKRRLKEEVDLLITSEDLVPKIRVDLPLSPQNITMGLIKELEVLEPYGEGNPMPVFLTQGLAPIDVRTVGDGSHLKLRLTDGRLTLDTIGFGLGDLCDKILSGSKYDIVYTLETNEWEGFEEAELSLIDIKESNGRRGP